MAKPGSAILSACSGPVAFFTDFDGTLVEIAESPDAVSLPLGTRKRLDTLNSVLDGAFAIVTGRTLIDLDTFFPKNTFTIAASHGAQLRHQGKTFSPDPDLGTRAQTIAARLRDTLGQDKRILIETKPAGVALHYRAAPDRGKDALAAMTDAIDGIEGFHFISGKKVYEARPKGIDKGTAIVELMRLAPFADRTPIFLGDDVTDEDGFARIQGMGGIGVRIGAGESIARFRLESVTAAHDLIDTILERESRFTFQSLSTNRGMVK